MAKHGKKASGIPLVKVISNGPIYRVVEEDGSLANGAAAPSDGGGFDNEKQAQHLAASINERRARRQEKLA